MPAHFGDSAELPATLEHSLRLDFHPDQLPLRWSHCSATADFLANYYQGLLKAQLPPSGLADLRHSISYLANELLENTVKFGAPGDVYVETGLAGADFILRLGNWIDSNASTAFQRLLAELTAGDPGELLLQRIEANAADESSSASGLGILTLMSDYQVRFSWSFTPEDDGRVFLRTAARLPLPSRPVT